MKKHELLNCLDDELLNKLLAYCYPKTNDSYEAEELCSDIILALLEAIGTDGEIQNIHGFIWKVAHNVYADFSKKRKQRAQMFPATDTEELFRKVPQEENVDDTQEQLVCIYRRIAFLTKAYREVMISFYLNGQTIAQIAQEQGVQEGTVRQRLFSARQQLKSEVQEMMETYEKPTALENMDFVFWGTGNPGWGDPSDVCTRMLSRHIIWLCRKKPMRPSEIAEELNVPTVYIEEELEILCKGVNGTYGLLRRLDSGKYVINFILQDKETMAKATAVCTEQLPEVCKAITAHIAKHKADYLALPYLNRKVDINLILWQQFLPMVYALRNRIAQILKEQYFADIPESNRPFTVYGYVSNGEQYGGGGWDGLGANNICGYSQVIFENIYITRIQKHFSCGHHVATDPLLQLALRAIDGIEIEALSEQEKEHAAKAVECGYLYRDEGQLYTKILVSPMAERERLFQIVETLQNNDFVGIAADIAQKLAQLFKKEIPSHLLGEWRVANQLAGLPLVNGVAEHLIASGVLIPPENGIGAEGCWMIVEK